MNDDYASDEPSRTEVDAWSGPALLEFGTDWCGHCLVAQPLVAHALADFPDVAHTRIKDGGGRRLGRTFGVKLWPTLVFLFDGKEIARLVRPKESETVRQVLVQLHVSAQDRIQSQR